ncbi:DCC1-like thiol-disulfide oxidoreductase family protein [Corynebacterium sp. H127]|uniref:DCC1-like thiol-disulfide oxidoreductase family protein n=1 Tax=Corynebacterium sp. H127 TaxID=3133418 RepID=UPI00403F164D
MFFYDADCGFCTWSAQHLQKLTTGVEIAPGKGLYIQHNAYFVDSQDRVYLGNRGIGMMLTRHGRNRRIRLLGRLLGLPIFKPVYRIIAWNRYRLGPLVGAGTCKL